MIAGRNISLTGGTRRSRLKAAGRGAGGRSTRAPCWPRRQIVRAVAFGLWPSRGSRVQEIRAETWRAPGFGCGDHPRDGRMAAKKKCPAISDRARCTAPPGRGPSARGRADFAEVRSSVVVIAFNSPEANGPSFTVVVEVRRHMARAAAAALAHHGRLTGVGSRQAP
jgi:hypothetical protein